MFTEYEYMTVYIEMCDVTSWRARPLCAAHRIPWPLHEAVIKWKDCTEEQGDEIHLHICRFILSVLSRLLSCEITSISPGNKKFAVASRSPQWRVYLVTILSRSRVRHGAGPRPAASYSELVRRYTIHLLIKLSIRPRLLYSAFNAGLMTDCHLSFSGGDDYRRCEYSESCTPSVEKWYVRSSCK